MQTEGFDGDADGAFLALGGVGAGGAGVHVSHILSKLGVSSRTQAARVAISQGLVEAS